MHLLFYHILIVFYHDLLTFLYDFLLPDLLHSHSSVTTSVLPYLNVLIDTNIVTSQSSSYDSKVEHILLIFWKLKRNEKG